MTVNETPEERRERLRQEELKTNSTGSLNTGFQRSQNASLVDLVGSLGWKSTVILIVFLIVFFIIYRYFQG